MKSTLIALANAWGPRFGGINSFNTDLIKSLGIQPNRGFEVFCILPSATEEEVESARRSYHVRIINLGYDQTQATYGESTIADIMAIFDGHDFRDTVWLGHDDKTGSLALQLRDVLGGKTALVHHMAHGAYQGYKKGDSRVADEKQEKQRLLFSKADHCFAVGPLLKKKLGDLLITEKTCPPITMLVPGLDDPSEYGVHCPESPPNFFTGFAAGRLTAITVRFHV